MGKFLLNTTPGKNYDVIVKSDIGIENEGVSLQLNSYHRNINFSITNKLANQSVPLYLVIYQMAKHTEFHK